MGDGPAGPGAAAAAAQDQRPARQPHLHRVRAARAVRVPARLLPVRRARRRGPRRARAPRAAAAGDRGLRELRRGGRRRHPHARLLAQPLLHRPLHPVDGLAASWPTSRRGRSRWCWPPSTTPRPTTTATTTSSPATRGPWRDHPGARQGRLPGPGGRARGAGATSSMPRSRGCVGGGRYVLGPEVEAFEERFAAFAGAAPLRGRGLRPGRPPPGPGGHGRRPGRRGARARDDVHRHLARRDAAPARDVVPVEPDPRTGNIDPDRLEAAHHAAHPGDHPGAPARPARAAWTRSAPSPTATGCA